MPPVILACLMVVLFVAVWLVINRPILPTQFMSDANKQWIAGAVLGSCIAAMLGVIAKGYEYRSERHIHTVRCGAIRSGHSECEVQDKVGQ